MAGHLCKFDVAIQSDECTPCCCYCGGEGWYPLCPTCNRLAQMEEWGSRDLSREGRAGGRKPRNKVGRHLRRPNSVVTI